MHRARNDDGAESRHHAYYGGAIGSWGNKFDPRHTPAGDAYIVIGRSCRRVNLRGSLDVGLPAGVRALGFENDASNRLVDVTLDTDNGVTREQLGIDYARLAGAGTPSNQVGAFRFRTRPGSVPDLPSGLLEFNVPPATVEYTPNEWTTGADGPQAAQRSARVGQALARYVSGLHRRQ
ncbi:MAG: hypothetical protein ACJ796_20600 [Gemmatimonadaceae bacterium]